MITPLLRTGMILIGFVPWLLKLPYMFAAWRTSRLDSWDWCFILASLILLAAIWPRLRRTVGPVNWWFCFAAAAGLAVYIAGIWFTIHALSILGGVLFLWGMTGLACGDKFAVAIMPTFGILCLSGTSTTYYLEYLFTSSGLLIKIIAAGILAALQIVLLKRREIPSKGILFACCSILLVGFYFFSDFQYDLYPPFSIALGRYSAGSFIGRSIPPSDADRRFFKESNIQRAFYADEHNNNVALLKVSDFSDPHKIHPAGHCLRTSGRNVVSEKLRVIPLPSGNLQVSEILVKNEDDSFMLVWAWYGNGSHSSGSFSFFRRMYTSTEDWSAWQIAINGSNLDSAREVLKSFLIAFHERSETAPSTPERR